MYLRGVAGQRKVFTIRESGTSTFVLPPAVPTAVLVKDNGAPAASTNAVTYLGSNFWYLEFTAGEITAELLRGLVTESGSDPFEFEIAIFNPPANFGLLSIDGTGRVVASSVIGNVGGDIVGGVTGGVGGDIQGKVIGSGDGVIEGTGVWANNNVDEQILGISNYGDIATMVWLMFNDVQLAKFGTIDTGLVSEDILDGSVMQLSGSGSGDIIEVIGPTVINQLEETRV